MNLFTDIILNHLPAKRKRSSSGWISCNAVCCTDTRGRGGFKIGPNGEWTWHCFNCSFTASWAPGKLVSPKVKKFLHFLNISDQSINKLVLESLKLRESGVEFTIEKVIPTFHTKELPELAKPIEEYITSHPDEIFPIVKYLSERKLYLEDYPFYWSPIKGFSNRVIIPFFLDGRIVGYTARDVVSNNSIRKYISDKSPGYVFNLDNQAYDREFAIVCEGPIDAISVGGCAIMGSEFTDVHNSLLKRLQKPIVLVPDRDHEGPKTVEQAIEYGWEVSMPDWPQGIKDINDAVCKLGRLATLWLISSSRQSSSLKIQLKAKKWFKVNNN